MRLHETTCSFWTAKILRTLFFGFWTKRIPDQVHFRQKIVAEQTALGDNNLGGDAGHALSLLSRRTYLDNVFPLCLYGYFRWLSLGAVVQVDEGQGVEANRHHARHPLP